MLAEEQARHLLAEAARTITPGPEPAVEAPPRQWRMPLIVGAAVVLVAGVVAAASLLQGGGAPRTVSPGPSGTPTIWSGGTYLGDPSYHLGPDQIPPVAGYPIPVATRILQQHGWTVSYRPQAGCPDNAAAAVYPGAGTVTPEGSIVVLTVNVTSATSGPGGAVCPVETRGRSGTADPFLLWAEGLGPTPRFAGGVGYVDAAAGVHVWLSPTRAQDPNLWPHLTDLTNAASTPDVRRVGSSLDILPRTVATGCSVIRGCEDRTVEVRSGSRILMSVLYTLTSDGSIDSVTIHDHRTPAYQGGLPHVVGDSGAYATARLQAWGYVVMPVYRVDCAPAGVVSRIGLLGHTAFIGVASGTGQCDSSPLVPQLAHHRAARAARADGLDHYRVTAADAFIAFARGGVSQPAWSDRVTYTIDGRPVATLTDAQAQHTASWEACPAQHGGVPCPISPLARIRALARAGGTPRIAVPPSYAACLPTPGALPIPADAASGAVTIAPDRRHPACATAFYVTLGLDGNDRVSSVDLSLPAG